MADPLRLVFFVDAGYLRNIGAEALGANASEVQVAGAGLINWVRRIEVHWGRLLRVYVYDGRYPVGHRNYDAQERHLDALAEFPGIRLRLGTLHDRPKKGLQQKGVDTLLVLDLLQMAQLNAYDVAVLAAGDADFVEAVDAVQRLGRTVVVMRVDQQDSGLSKALRQAADDVAWISVPELQRIVEPVEASSTPS